MQFNSYVFILLFLPVTVIFYFLFNKINSKLGRFFLLAASLVFYAYSGWIPLGILAVSLAVNYCFAVFIRRAERFKKVFLILPVLVNVCLLGYYKYTNFVIVNINSWFSKDIALKNLILPLGISFFTFQQIAYIVAIYQGEIEECSLFDYLLFILYFPKILMGPLMDPVDFISQVNDTNLKRVNYHNIACGLKILSFGLFKKVMMADVFALAVNWGYSNYEMTSSMDWMLIMLFYAFELYFDFSGYCDMATGVSLMLNITLPMNFDSTYKAISVRDYWKRWHLTLTRFFTKYIYIPLGGSRKGLLFTCINTMIVFTVSGIWHGANWTYILWGVLNGIIVIGERQLEGLLSKIYEPFRWLCAFVLIDFLLILFRSESIPQWISIIGNIFSFQELNVSEGLMNIFVLPESSFLGNILGLNPLINSVRGFWMLVYIIFTSAICFGCENNYRKLNSISYVSMVAAAVAFVWSVISLCGESVFLYFNF